MIYACLLACLLAIPQGKKERSVFGGTQKTAELTRRYGNAG